MNQHDQMREALLLARTCLKSFHPDTFDKKAIQDYSQTMVAIEQSLAAEPAPLVRLTNKQIMEIDETTPGGLIEFANVIMDEMERVNK